MKRQKLIEERTKRNMTQAQTAETLGISEVYVRKLESGTVNPGRKTMFKFEEHYGINAKKLFPDLFFDHNDKKVINKRTG